MEFSMTQSLNLVTDCLSSALKSPGLILKPIHAFKNTNPVYFAILSLIAIFACTYIQTRRTNRYVWVDRIWSISPLIYAILLNIHFFYHHKSFHTRMIMASSLITLWSFRLTYNLYRKGGWEKFYHNTRWTVARQQVSTQQWQWELFVFLVMHVALLTTNWMIGVFPLIAIYNGDHHDMKSGDMVLVLIHLAFLIYESIADSQQFAFQTKKSSSLKENWTKSASYDENYATRGLFKYSRHPALFGEIGQWVTLFLFSREAWTSMGVVFLMVIVWRSTILQETISKFQYPKYKYYAMRTSCIIPTIPGPRHAKESLSRFEK